MDGLFDILLQVADKGGPYGLIIAAVLWMRFNHVEHLASDLRELKADHEAVKKDVVEIKTDVAFIKGKMNGERP